MTLGTYAAQSYQYPLDMMPNAALAISMRQLTKTFITRIMTIRRASDNATTDLSFDSTGKISNSSPVSAGGTLGTWGSATNCFIQTHYDQSGNSNNLSQTTLAAQPQLTSSGAVISPGPTYAGSPSAQNLSISALTQGTLNVPITSFAVAQNTNSASGNYYSICDSFGSATRFAFRFNGSVAGKELPQVANITGTTLLSFNTMYLLSGFNASSSASVYVNGILDSSNTTANTSAFTGFYMANTPTGNSSWGGNICEVILYPSILSTSQFQALNANMKNFYGIP